MPELFVIEFFDQTSKPLMKCNVCDFKLHVSFPHYP
jgi:hypothetical protein